MLGSNLVEVPAKPYKDPNNYLRYSERLAKSLKKPSDNGAFWANQFDNQDNRIAHIENTAQEIWMQTEGKIDGFIEESRFSSGFKTGTIAKQLKLYKK